MNDLSNIIIKHDDSKRLRKHNAITLPESLNHVILPKYVGYYKECYNNEAKLYREFFKIEKHPNQSKNKAYISSKSNKISILEKLDQINKILDGLNSLTSSNELDEASKSNIIKLPKYISIRSHETQANKYYLSYDNKSTSKRNTLNILCSNSSPLTTNLELFIKKIEEKFK
jgi:hypothetical protein